MRFFSLFLFFSFPWGESVEGGVYCADECGWVGSRALCLWRRMLLLLLRLILCLDIPIRLRWGACFGCFLRGQVLLQARFEVSKCMMLAMIMIYEV